MKNLNLPTGSYEQPSGIVEAAVCSKSGLLPVEGLCDQDPEGNCVITEYFTEDTVPTEYCTTHVKVSICNESGDIATSGCPSVTTKIMRKKSSADKLGEDKDGSEFKTWDADISITDTELSKLCTIHSATTKPSKVTPGTGSNKNNSKETTAASTETSGKTNSSDKRP
ncbi:MAG: hypothetical protein ACLRMX_05210 [Lachnospira eligens]